MAWRNDGPEEYEWIEKTGPSKKVGGIQPGLEWMLDPSALLKSSKPEKKIHEVRIEEAKKLKRQIGLDRAVHKSEEREYVFGDRGSSWRMMQLDKILEQEDVIQAGIAQYGSMSELSRSLDESSFLEKDTVRGNGFVNPVTEAKIKKIIRLRKDMQKYLQKVEVNDDKKREHTNSLPRDVGPSIEEPVLNTDELNLLFSKVVRARLMKSKKLNELEAEFIYEKELFDSVERTQLKRARIHNPKNIKKDKLVQKEMIITQDENLNDLIRDEKINKKSNLDSTIAHNISKDASFENTLDYLDQSNHCLSSEVSKRNRADKNDECIYCIEQTPTPKITVVSKGFETYLALPQSISMLPLHCLIIPMEHVTSTLELDDEAWIEMRNFMKSLMKMAASQSLAMIFIETHIGDQHAIIECIPIPESYYADTGAYYRQAILDASSEWSQHKRVIDTGVKGFRASMVKNLAYVHIWITIDGGYGHIIEDSFDDWFGRGVIGGMLDIDVERWRRPKLCGLNEVGRRARAFQASWTEFDWTLNLD